MVCAEVDFLYDVHCDVYNDDIMKVNVSQAIMNIPPDEKNITNVGCVIMFVYQKIC